MNLKQLCVGLVTVGLVGQAFATSVQMDPRRLIYSSAQMGNIRTIEQLQQQGYSLEMTDAHGNTPLCEAIWRQDATSVKVLLYLGASMEHPCIQNIPDSYFSKVGLKKNVPVTDENIQNIEPIVEELEDADNWQGLTTYKTPKTIDEENADTSMTTKVAWATLAAAAVGTGIALSAGGGGGSGTYMPPCHGHGTLLPGDICECEEHYIGDRCELCEDGYDHYGTSDCHETITCGLHEHQRGDVCVCDTGYTNRFGGGCVAELTCNHHGTQTGDGTCSCQTGWDPATQCETCISGYGHHGVSGVCYADLNCGTEAQGVQHGDHCVCSDPWQLNGPLCTSCKLTGPAGSVISDATTCACNTADGYKRVGNRCTHDCGDNAYWDGSACKSCEHGGSGGSDATSCTCVGNWGNSVDCSGCRLDGAGVIISTCQCDSASGYLQVGYTCVYTEVKCDEGQYVDSATRTCMDCKNGGTSPGGNVTACTCPASGHFASDSYDCSVCEPNYTEGSGCSECTSDAIKGSGGICYNKIEFCKDGKQSNNTCSECEDGYEPSQDKTRCVPDLCNGETCNNHGTCSAGVCKCTEGSHWNPDKKCGTCMGNWGGSGDDCDTCLLTGDPVTGLGVNMNTCECNEGYVQEETRCIHKFVLIEGHVNNANKHYEHLYNITSSGGVFEIYGMENNSDSITNYNAKADETTTGDSSAGTIDFDLTFTGTGTDTVNIYGMGGSGDSVNASATDGKTATGRIDIDVDSTGYGGIINIYGMGGFGTTPVINATGDNATGTINIQNNGSGFISGMSAPILHNAIDGATGSINITNNGASRVYGMYGRQIETGVAGATTIKSTININNTDTTAEVYGIYGQEMNDILPSITQTSDSSLSITGSGEGATGVAWTADNTDNNSQITNAGTITIGSETTPATFGHAYGIGNQTAMYATINNTGTISIHNTNPSYGIYAKYSTITNSGTINISGQGDGIFGQDSDIINANGANINMTSATGDHIHGIYALRSDVWNNGTITITSGNGYGIYTKSEGETGFHVHNSGEIIIAGNSKTGAAAHDGTTDTEHFIHLDTGYSFDSSGVLESTSSIDFSSWGPGTVVAHEGSKWRTNQSMSGSLYMAADYVTDNFDTQVIAPDMIRAQDTDNLNLISKSALYDAKLADNQNDVILSMKSFDKLTDNTSLAQFLRDNYQSKNNMNFFNTLKSIENTSALKDSLNNLMGHDVLSRYAFEDLSMMREINLDMNNQLFHAKDNYLTTAGQVQSMAFKGTSSGRYSLFNKRDGATSIGLGVSFTDLQSTQKNDDNTRSDTAFQMVIPFGYRTKGMQFITSPRLGYARGHYDRMGLNNSNYDGVIEKRVYGVMNEARYPIQLGAWSLEPSVEFNVLGYQQQGSEEAKAFSLTIPKQNTLSVEGGVGLYLQHEDTIGLKGKVNLSAGLAVYHEFADPYQIKLGMNQMVGTFNVRDENQGQNRAVFRTTLDYNYGDDISLYGSFMSHISKDTRSQLQTGLKYQF